MSDACILVQHEKAATAVLKFFSTNRLFVHAFLRQSLKKEFCGDAYLYQRARCCFSLEIVMVVAEKVYQTSRVHNKMDDCACVTVLSKLSCVALKKVPLPAKIKI